MRVSLLIVATASIGCRDGTPSTPDVRPLLPVTVSAPQAPDALVAARAEGGSWNTGNGAEPITFEASDTFTVAIGCLATNEAVVYQLSVSDLTTLVSDLLCVNPGATTAKLAGTLTVSTSYPVIGIAWGTDTAEIDTTVAPATYTMAVPLGTHDLVAASLARGPGGQFFEYARVVYGVEVTRDTNVDLDLSTATALASGGDGGPQGQYTMTGSYLITANGTRFELSGSRYLYYTQMPDAALGPDDRQLLRYTNDPAFNDPAFTVEQIARVPTQLTIAAPSPAPIFNPEYVQWRRQTGAVAYALRFTGRTYFASPAVFDATETLSIPDLSGVPGWTFSMTATGGSIAAIQTSAALDDAIRLVPRSATLYVWMH